MKTLLYNISQIKWENSNIGINKNKLMVPSW